MHVFVDESGDFGFTKNSSSHVVMAALIVHHESALQNCIKRMRRGSFKMELQGVNEIKASHSSPSLKQHMITRLNTVRDAEAIFIILDKHAMNRVYNSRNGYKALFLALDTDIGNKHIQAVTIDRIVAKGVFDQTYKPLFRTRGYPSSRVEVNQGLSHEHAGLQFADLLAWVGFRKHEYSDNKLYDLLSIRKEEHVIKQ